MWKLEITEQTETRQDMIWALEELIKRFDQDGVNVSYEPNAILSEVQDNGSQIEYRGAFYPALKVLYKEKGDNNAVPVPTYVSTNELNTILYSDTRSKSKEIKTLAEVVDKRVGFFVAESRIKEDDPKELVAALNIIYNDFAFFLP